MIGKNSQSGLADVALGIVKHSADRAQASNTHVNASRLLRDGNIFFVGD